MSMFDYVMVLASIIVGLGITHLLQGLADIIQNRDRARAYWVHVVWVGYMFLTTVLWWWWEFRFREVAVWTLQLYFFVLAYAVLIYLICAMLFPRNIDKYEGFKGYFYASRGWLFGLLAAYFAIDLADTWFKGAAHFFSLGTEYIVASVSFFVLCVAAAMTKNQRFHAGFAVASLGYLVTYALRFFETVN